jgi:lipoprotein NlpD
MFFPALKLNLLIIVMITAFMNACATSSIHAPVTVTGQELSAKAAAITVPAAMQPSFLKNRRTFHAGDLNSAHGYRQPAVWSPSPPSSNLMAVKRTKRSRSHSDSGMSVSPESAHSLTNESRKTSEDTRNKQSIKADSGKKSRRHSQKSSDDKKILKLNFGWPIKGHVLRRFSKSRNKGIDIAGTKGQPVIAAENGTVVYGGQGLIGFGKILIIKHGDAYLSAYANTSRLLVKEGEPIEKGQIIAEVGNVGIKRASLHFEIRKNGKPVDPLNLLPKN